MNPQNKNTPKQIYKPQPIPNNLNITINTSVPGFQTLKYKPNMTIPDIGKDDNAVMFNPLVKLNKNVINKVPENLRIKEFFNRGLFDSLINLHGLQKVPSLAQATYDGYVDHNIYVTLQELFPINGLIYINKQPYRIGDVQWRKGEWRVAQKYIDLPQLDANKIEDPFLFQAVVRDDIISGSEQLSNLPDNIVFGPNYNIEQDPTAQGRPKTEEAKKQEQQLLLLGPPPPSPEPKQIETPKKQPLALPAPPQPTVPQIEAPAAKELLQIEAPHPQPTVPQIEAPPAKELPQIEAPPAKELPQIEGPPKKDLLQIEAAPMPIVEEIPEPIVEEDNIPVPDPNLKKNAKSKIELKDYFGSNKYYEMINEMYKNMGNAEKAIISGIFRQTTETNVKEKTKNLSKTANDELVNNLFVYDSSGGGECFFCAVAQGINLHNFNHQDKKITYKFINKINSPYGKGDNIFTTDVIRKIVAIYVYKNYKKVSSIKGMPNVNLLNDIFENEIKDKINSINDTDYMELINNIFEGNQDNEFLVYKPTNITSITNKSRPFSLISEENVVNYIKTVRYWGDQLSIEALIGELKLYTIVITKDRNGSFSIADPMFVSDKNADDNNKLENKWEYYMFLYHHDFHYELISFKYIVYKKGNGLNNKIIANAKDVNYSIFERNGNIYPPFYIIYFIFATLYIVIEKEKQDLFFFYMNIFISLKETFLKIYKKFAIEPESSINERKFFTNFIEYFNYTISGNFRRTYPALDKIVVDEEKLETKRKGTKKRRPKNTNLTRKNRNPPVSSIEESDDTQSGGQALITPYKPTPYRPTPYRPTPYKPPYTNPQTVSQIIKRDTDKSNIAYYITIEMQLIKGKEPLSNDQMRGQKCGNKWNAVRKSFSELTGTKYVIPPVYENYSSKEKDNKK